MSTRYYSGGIWYNRSSTHTGIDLAATNGRDIYSCAAGTVLSTNTNHASWGHVVEIGHADGKRTLYCHMTAGSIAVSPGQVLTGPTKVGTVGSTGDSAAPHLHLILAPSAGQPSCRPDFYYCDPTFLAHAPLAGSGSSGVPIQNPPAWSSAFQANTGNLIVFSGGTNGVDSGQGMAAGTSPAITHLTGGGWVAAFQANTGSLYVYSSVSGTQNRNQGMAGGSSPAIAALSGGSWVSAFRANHGRLVIHSPNFDSHDSGQDVMAGTSPSIMGLPSANGWIAAFQAPDGNLRTYSHTAAVVNAGQGMKAGSSPDIAVRSDGNHRVAFQANNNNLIVWWPGGGQATGQAIHGTTSPSIAIAPDGSNYGVGYHGSNGSLQQWTSAYGNWNTGYGMALGTSPSTRYLGDGSLRMSFQANTGNLFEYSSNGSTAFDLGQGMAGGTSPAID